MAFTNSPLVTYTRLTQDRTHSNHAIELITIHCFVGQVTAKEGCDYFATTDRQVSSNYVVGKDGSIGLSVEEKDRAWTTGGKDKNGNVIRVNGISGADTDHRAVTIEVASNSKAPYAVTTEAYKALVELVADICKRNGIKKLLWKGDKSLVGQFDKQNMMVHKWFALKDCPGDYLYERLGEIANEVNKRLGTASPSDTVGKTPEAPSEPPKTQQAVREGMKLTLKNTPLYVSSTEKNKASDKSGVFYVWGDEVLNGRIRITNRKSNVGVQGQVTGWIDVASIGAVDQTASVPYRIKVTVPTLNIRKAPDIKSPITGVIQDKGVYTIVEEASGTGAGKWGRLKSGVGWISLDYTKRV